MKAAWRAASRREPFGIRPRGHGGGQCFCHNPEGLACATWVGVAEAVDIASFERRQGTAALTTPELSEPFVGVAIDGPGFVIGFPDWAGIGMPLRNGRFTYGVRGGTYLEGNLHGPGHGEAYGVFDNTDYNSAFGARWR